MWSDLYRYVNGDLYFWKHKQPEKPIYKSSISAAQALHQLVWLAHLAPQ